jgi:acetyltransferase
MREKPVVAIKVGRSQAGRDAVASHTGALAGRDAAYTAAFRKAGVIRAESSEEMFDWARALAWCPPLAGRWPCSPPAGPASQPTRRGQQAQVADLSRPRADLRISFPHSQRSQSVGALAVQAGRVPALATLLADDEVQGVMVILLPPPMSTAAGVVGRSSMIGSRPNRW